MKLSKKLGLSATCAVAFLLFTSIASPSAVNSRFWWAGFAWQAGTAILFGVVTQKVARSVSSAARLQSMLECRGYRVPLSILMDLEDASWKAIEEKIEVFEVDPQAFGSLTELLGKEVGR